MTNPFEFEYNEILDEIKTTYKIKSYRDCKNLDYSKQYIKIDFSIYKILDKVDYFTWLIEPDIEVNFQLELYFELDKDLIEKINQDEYWFNCWHKNSKYATDKIKLIDTYIPTYYEYINC